jgi:hypothetical protein
VNVSGLNDLVVAAIGAGGGAGALALANRILFRREESNRLNAQATDTQAQAFARIIQAAGAGLENQATIVPTLIDRIAKLEARDEDRETEVATLRDRLDSTSDELAATRARLEQAAQHAATVDDWMDSLLAWWADHRQWDESVLTAIERLGGHVERPQPMPDRRRVPAQGFQGTPQQPPGAGHLNHVASPAAPAGGNPT